jgi:hypothetical protein
MIASPQNLPGKNLAKTCSKKSHFAGTLLLTIPTQGGATPAVLIWLDKIP